MPKSEIERLLTYFEFNHLPAHLQMVSRPICILALDIAENKNYDQKELEAGLRKLLEAKDCFVRAAL